jgi:transposase
VLADSLRTDGRAYRRIDNDHPDVIELREWSRMATDLTAEDVALCNQARQQLSRFYPQILELSGDTGEAFILALLEAAPTPAKAQRLRSAQIEKLLRDHKIRRWTSDEILAILRKPALVVAPGTTEAAVGHLRQLVARIRLVRRQLAECREKLDEILARLGAEEAQGRKNEPRDVEILLSLPGVGRIVAASLLAEASRPLRDRDYQALRTLSGIAPVTKRSGRTLVVEMRRACNLRLRDALHHAARNAGQTDDAWKTRCAALRARGQTHGRACRGVADALLRVALAMLRTRTLYDPSKIGATRAKAAA